MIYYIGYYNCDQIRHEDRQVSPAASNKMNYLISALVEAGDDSIEVVSPAETKKHAWISGGKWTISERVAIKTFPSVCSRFRLVRILGHILTRLCFLVYLLLHINQADKMIVYHSLVYPKLISFVRRVKKCTLIMEVEEIYADVNENSRLRDKELCMLQCADKYIFITELLRNEINQEKKSVIFHGTYRTVPDYGIRFRDDKIHVVYAGTFDPVKGGVFQAISAAEYLNESYVLHILGGGSASEIEAVRNRIREVSEKSECKICYDGFKSGDEFDSFIQSCHIGLSTQQPDGKFNATSFPSKILMYMSNGVRVVSVRIRAVETSLVGSSLFYYDQQDAKSIAEAIMAVPCTADSECKEVLDCLHNKFVYSLGELLDN